ncbi:MAG: hypothetical protein Q7T82_11340 [Armatimonadota bacterium]|nr:hypothetical protein [Armatimonadota bacterium]
MGNSTKVSLKIIPFKNPSGHLAFRVSGTIHGERVQKNFPTDAEARTFMNGLVAAAGQGESSPRRVATTIFPLDTDLHEAELAWQRLRAQDPKGSLVTAVDYYLVHAGHVIRDGDAAEAVEGFSEHRRSRGNQENTVTTVQTVLMKFLEVAKVAKISDFTRAAAQPFISDKTVSMRTRRDRYDHLYNWSEYLKGERHLVRNFIGEMDRPQVTYDGVVTTLSVPQVLTLLRTAARAPVGRRKREGAMLAYFAACVLSGLRPEEAERLGPDWRWYSREHRLITGFRAKTKSTPRTVALDKNLIGILEYCRKQGFAPSDFSEKAFDLIRTKANVYEAWDNDVLRHTYASHHYAWKKDMGYLEKNMGNSEVVLKRAYLDQTIPEKVGATLFAITLKDILAP